MRKYHVRVESVLYDSSVYQFNVDDELVCRCASFISKCLLSDNGVVKALARNGVYFMRMLSPVGVNSPLCDYYGLSLLNIHAVCKPLAWSAFRQSVLPELDTIYTIHSFISHNIMG